MDELSPANAPRILTSERETQRRSFFKLAGGVAAGAAGAVVLAGGFAQRRWVSEVEAQTTPALSDQDVLNFALNLEYLESNYYLFATTGAGLPGSDATGAGAQGAVLGGAQVPFASPVVGRLAGEIAQDELKHVAFLRGQLGAAAVAQPQIDLSVTPTSAFSKAAQSAGLIPAGATFNPFANDENFLLGAYLLTDVGVSAYIGSSVLISNVSNLQAAAGILATEAYHASILRTSLYDFGVEGPTALGGTVALSQNPFTATQAISAARQTLDGDGVDHGIGAATAPTIANASLNNSVCFGRTPQQVLNEVYLNPAAVSAGGFFPAGVNGAVVTSG